LAEKRTTRAELFSAWIDLLVVNRVDIPQKIELNYIISKWCPEESRTVPMEEESRPYYKAILLASLDGNRDLLADFVTPDVRGLERFLDKANRYTPPSKDILEKFIVEEFGEAGLELFEGRSDRDQNIARMWFERILDYDMEMDWQSYSSYNVWQERKLPTLEKFVKGRWKGKERKSRLKQLKEEDNDPDRIRFQRIEKARSIHWEEFIRHLEDMISRTFYSKGAKDTNDSESGSPSADSPMNFDLMTDEFIQQDIEKYPPLSSVDKPTLRPPPIQQIYVDNRTYNVNADRSVVNTGDDNVTDFNPDN
jgi:hypothetical protein